MKTEYPKLDLHAHIENHTNADSRLTFAQVADISRQLGVVIGVAEEEGASGTINSDADLLSFLEEIAPYPLYAGLQVTHRDWHTKFSKEALDKLDYILGDSLIMPSEDNSCMIHIWEKRTQVVDAEAFMERYFEHTLRILDEPITLWGNPTLLPPCIADQYEALWSAFRRHQIIEKLVNRGLVMEINSRYQVPGQTFIREACEAGVKFSFGSNAHVDGIGDIARSLEIAAACDLPPEAIFVPDRKLPDVG